MYLEEFVKYSKNRVAYLPLGTIEWHGNHLPVETDFLVAQKICDLISKKKPGLVLPPIYLGTDRTIVKNGKKFIGMNGHVGKELAGSIYYLDPNLLFSVIGSLIRNLKAQGFNEIYIVTGHAGSKQIEILKKIINKYKGVSFFNPYDILDKAVEHADEYETSLFWACYPEEEAVSRKRKIGKADDFLNYQGYDAREKASLEEGKKMLKNILQEFNNIVNC